MGWTLGNVRIFVQDHESNVEQIIARLNPLGGGVILQVFGNDPYITRLAGKVVGVADATLLDSYTTSGIPFDLVVNNQTPVPYYVKKVTAKLSPSICQTLRPDLPSDSFVYDTQIELWYDD